MSVSAERKLLISVLEASKLLGLGRDRCYALCRSGVLPSVRVGRRVLVVRTGLEQLVERIVRGEIREFA